jgi:bifunctional non-homologous end joining protein LigD
MKDRIPFRVQPMLATLVSQPFHKTGWVYEEKYDGFRIVAYKEGAGVSLLSRNGKDRTQTYTNIAAAVAKLPYRTLLLDGEMVAFDSHRVSRFQLLKKGKVPPLDAVFDCLYQNGRDLRAEPLSTRRRGGGDSGMGTSFPVSPSGPKRARGLRGGENQRLRRDGRQRQLVAVH